MPCLFIYIRQANYEKLRKAAEKKGKTIGQIAGTPEEIQGLLETGFEYVMSKDNLAFFRKRR